MAEASSQDHTDGLNVPGNLPVQEFEDFKGDETERRTEDHHPEQPSNTGDLQDYLAPWRRNLTEKGLEEKINRLKQHCTNSLRSVSRKRTELSQLMVDVNNLHLVKDETAKLIDLIEEYKEAFSTYYQELTNEEDKEHEHAHFKERVEDMMAYLHPLNAWMSQAEARLTDQLDGRSNKGSERSSKASSRLSARDRERVRLAELKAERSMLKRKQALRAAEEDLELDTEIAKTEAREKALSEIDREHETPPPPLGSGPPSVAASFTPIVIKSAAKSSPDNDAVSRNPHSSSATPETTRAINTEVDSSPKISKADDFTPGMFAGEISSTPLTSKGLETSKESSHRVSEAQSPQLAERTFQNVIELQQKQNETVIATHQQLTAAMTLPQPTITKFTGDPIEYKTFVMAFDTRIRSKASTSSDLLYYLNQHLEGEPADLIQGCLHMDPEAGYTEARRLLQKEYGDPYKISTAYLNKIIHWPPVRYDDNQALKRLSIFLTKCNIAMKSISYMRVLDHAPNMQSVVSKLPANLQAKWRDQVLKKKRREDGVACFSDLAEFVEYASESANDPVFGKEALSKSKEDVKPKEREPPSKGKKPPKKPEKPWRPKENSFVTTPLGAVKPPAVYGAGPPSNYGRPPCHLCSLNHDLDDCDVFNKKTPEFKRVFLRERNMCFGCYGTSHISRNCPNRRKCRYCGQLHPSALHISGFQIPPRDNSRHENDKAVANACTNLQSSSCNTTKPEESVVLHAILPVRVKKKGSKETITTYAFYDNGSSGCFLTESLREKIGADGEKTQLQLGTMHGQSLITTTVVSDLVVADMEGKNPVELPQSYTSFEIPVTERQIPTPEAVKRWEHLHSVAEKIPEFIPNLEIGLLIGSNCPTAMEPLEVVPSGDKGPYAMRLRHGWTLSGPLYVENISSPGNVTCHTITVREVESFKEVISPQAIQQMFELDFNDHKSSPDEYGYSQEDKKFIDRITENVHHHNGHYVIPLPFRNSQVTMPQQPFTLGQVPDDDPEVRKVTTSSVVSINQVDNATIKLINSFSDWHHLRRAVAVFLRVKETLRRRRNDRVNVENEAKCGNRNPADQKLPAATKAVKFKSAKESRSPLTVQDLATAELAILKFVQASAFGKEIHALKEGEKNKLRGKKKGGVKNDSPIRRLDPFLDNGVLRVGGRLRRADLPFESKHPAILPKKSHVTTLLIRHAHKRLGHAGRSHIIANLRERYWIIKVNAAARHVISKCVFCRRNHGKPSEQKMADLPRDCISPAPPFTYTGVDYFGPFLIKEGRKEVKKYGAIFTCLDSRAVHIEVASSLESSSFIQTLQRFIARSGPVREMRSDNGTNFVGTHNELLQAIQEMDHEEIRAKLQRENIDWTFNLPAASHMGGVWERQIKTTRKILAGLMDEYGHCLDEESFRILMCEVETVINSRPSMTVSGEPGDLEPLTPNHILTTKSTVILPPPGEFQKNDVYMRRRWRRVQYLANLFWSQWKKEYLVVMQERRKWQHPQRNLIEGDIMIIREENVPRNAWSLALVVQVEQDAEGLVRSVVVKTRETTLRRPINKFVLILPKEEQEGGQEKK